MGGLRRSRGRLIGISIGAVTGLASLMMVGAPAVAETTATPVTSCGQSVDSDAVLTRDLVCTGVGVALTAGVTLNLAGHILRSSTGTSPGIEVDGPLGTEIAIHGPGTIRGFGVGIDAHRRVDEHFSSPQYRHHLVVDGGLKLLDNGLAIGTQRVLTDATAITVRGANGIGMGCHSPGCDSAGQINVDRSTFTISDTLFDPEMFGSVWVTNSRLHGGRASSTINGGLGFSDSILQGVELGCSESGISINRSRAIDTVVNGGSYCSLNLQDNTFRGTDGGTGVSLGPDNTTSRSTIARNTFSGWTTAVSVGPYAPNVGIVDNLFARNGIGIDATCIRFGSSPSSGTIEHNSLVRNQGDAIRLGCGTWTLGRNRMIHNGGVGVAADLASAELVVVDAGGNVANQNAEPQCTGVVCSPR